MAGSEDHTCSVGPCVLGWHPLLIRTGPVIRLWLPGEHCLCGPRCHCQGLVLGSRWIRLGEEAWHLCIRSGLHSFPQAPGWCVLLFVVECDSTEGHSGFIAGRQCRHGLPMAVGPISKSLWQLGVSVVSTRLLSSETSWKSLSPRHVQATKQVASDKYGLEILESGRYQTR